MKITTSTFLIVPNILAANKIKINKKLNQFYKINNSKKCPASLNVNSKYQKYRTEIQMNITSKK